MRAPHRLTDPRVRAPRALAGALGALAVVAVAAGAQPSTVPFAVGERLVYGVKVARVGSVGRGEMTVEGPVQVRGQATVLLRFDFSTRVGPVKVVNESASWLDLDGMRALRFRKHERHPLSNHDETVELYPEQRRWESAGGARGEMTSDRPLDELSYIYFIRTLPLVADSTYRFDRHFESARNPTTVRMVGRELVVTPAGRFQTLLVEMRVKDTRRFKGDGTIWINLTDDACRLPVRIQSRMPVVGAAVLTLESHSHPAEHFAPRLATAPVTGNP